jgi:hypothetical protein
MDFTVEFYETETGKCPVREFLDELKASDPDDFAAVVAGLAKLRNRPFLEKRISPQRLRAHRGFLFVRSASRPRRLGGEVFLSREWRKRAEQ